MTTGPKSLARPLTVAIAGTLLAFGACGLDQNGDGLNDIWALSYGVSGLAAAGDADGDGFTNAQESNAGTDPFAASSHPNLGITWADGGVRLAWPGIAGKAYSLVSRPAVAAGIWTTNATVLGEGAPILVEQPTTEAAAFFQLIPGDVDSDGDGLTDAEERWLSFDPKSVRSERRNQPDLQRFNATVNAASVVTLGTLDPLLSERWPDPGLVAVRRKGGLKPITVNLAFGGTATKDTDYTTATGTSVTLPLGVREVWVELHPVADPDDAEPTETITVTALPGVGYTVGASNVAALTLANETATSNPSAKAAARFLIQAVFGPDQDSPNDANQLPENVEEVMALGFEIWLDNEFARPPAYLQPWVEWAAANAQNLELYGNWKQFAWWGRVMGSRKLRPDATTDTMPDPLRQRMAFALSQILVTSDRPESIATEQVGMANYYDLMVKHAFGNYHDLLLEVALHPVMGIYLSHLGNRKADPVNRIYPDENFAREIMQLFTIGLWELNPDGSRKQNSQGQPIPTYSNADITELARVFTGLSFGNNDTFRLHPRDFTVPMKMWDEEHDCAAKTLIRGLALPARPPSDGNTGTAGLADVQAAVNNLFQHPNVGPFVGRQLIQRFITSNPSPGYVARVSAVFADNGSSVRGDLKAVLRAILLDPEARDPQNLNEPTWGKLREPFLRVVNYARAFNAFSTSGHYALDQFTLDHMQDPMSAPSVFNFFLPAHSPPGPITQQGLVAPEFQIINASSAITGPNYFWNSIGGDLHRYGHGRAEYVVRLSLNQELGMIAPAAQIIQDVPAGPPGDIDALLRRLDLVLTGGTLTPQHFQLIREAMERVGPPSWQWHRERLRLAIYLIVTSADFNVLH